MKINPPPWALPCLIALTVAGHTTPPANLTAPSPSPSPSPKDTPVLDVPQSRIIDALLTAEEDPEVQAARTEYKEARVKLESAIKVAALRLDPDLSDWWASRENAGSARLEESEVWIPMGPFQREFKRRKMQNLSSGERNSPAPEASPSHSPEKQAE